MKDDFERLKDYVLQLDNHISKDISAIKAKLNDDQTAERLSVLEEHLGPIISLMMGEIENIKNGIKPVAGGSLAPLMERARQLMQTAMDEEFVKILRKMREYDARIKVIEERSVPRGGSTPTTNQRIETLLRDHRNELNDLGEKLNAADREIKVMRRREERSSNTPITAPVVPLVPINPEKVKAEIKAKLDVDMSMVKMAVDKMKARADMLEAKVQRLEEQYRDYVNRLPKSRREIIEMMEES